MTRSAPPFAFFFLHLCTAWPVGVVALAMGNRLVQAGVPVQQTASIIAAALLPFSFEFMWAPLVDGCLTRRIWYICGVVVMAACLAALLVAPWRSAAVPLMTLLAFCSCSGAAIGAVAVKGIMAHEVPAARIGAASGFYTAGNVAKAIGGSGTLWLLTHLDSRPVVAALSVTTAAFAGAAILLCSSSRPKPLSELPAGLRAAFVELWDLIRTPAGLLIAVLCVVPFGSASEAGLVGAIAREWSVTPDQLALFGILGAVAGVAGALFSGWLATCIGTWKVYLVHGWAMIAAMAYLAFAPREVGYFIAVELLYRGMASACYASLLGIIMTAIGRGAASTKAAALWSLANFASAYPTVIDGAVHDHVGTRAMLLTDAGLGLAGFGVLLVAARLLRLPLGAPIDACPAASAAI